MILTTHPKINIGLDILSRLKDDFDTKQHRSFNLKNFNHKAIVVTLTTNVGN